MLAAVFTTAVSNSAASEFSQILKSPKRFDGKRVTVQGIAEIGGSEFFLYPSRRDLRRGQNAIFVYRDLRHERLYEELNYHWLRITGIVDLKIRPPLGVGECSLVPERVEPMPGRVMKSRFAYAIFKNDTADTINVKFSGMTGATYLMRFAPGDISSAVAIVKGAITAETASGKVVAQGYFMPANGSRDTETHTPPNYYRISAGKIESVPAENGRQWLKVRTPP